MMVVRKCDVVVKKWVVGAKKHDGPIVVVKKQVMVVKKKKVDAKNAGGYEKNAEQYPIPQTGLGWADPGLGRGRARSGTLALDPMRARPDHKILALFGSGQVSPRANQGRPCPWTVYKHQLK